MSEILQFNCPGCERTIRVRDGARGRAVACPGCGKKLRIPGVPTPNADSVDATSHQSPPTGRSYITRPARSAATASLRQASGSSERKPAKPKATLTAQAKPSPSAVRIPEPTLPPAVLPQNPPSKPTVFSLDSFDMGGFDVEDDVGSARSADNVDDFFGLELPAAALPSVAPPKPTMATKPIVEPEARNSSSEPAMPADSTQRCERDMGE